MSHIDSFHDYPIHWTDSDFRSLISMLISVARADGISEQEMKLIKLASEALQWTEAELKEALNSTNNEVPERLQQDGVYLLRDLYLLAMADEKVQDKERETINRISSALKISEAQKACIEKAVVHRLMSDSFWQSALNNTCKLNP